MSLRPVMRQLRFSIWLAVLAVFAVRADAATNIVTTLADSGPGSLRDAISNANANVGTDTIVCTEVRGVITLASALPPLAEGIELIGPSRNLLCVSGDYRCRVLQISAGAVVRIRGLTIANGFDLYAGAGILNDGSLTLVDCALTNNGGAGYFGVGPWQGGGAIFSRGTLSVLDSLVISNQARSASSPSSSIEGGAVHVEGGSATISNTAVLGNYVIGAYGGYLGGPGGSALGGGLSARNADVQLIICTLAGNIAQGGPGGASIHYGFDGGWGLGGAIFAMNSSVRLTNCTVSENLAQGGPGGSGGLTSGMQGLGAGGGIYASSNSVFLMNCTIYRNSAVGGQSGQGIDGATNGSTLKNTILQQGSIFANQGHNLLENPATFTGSDVVVTQLNLAPLQNNGGPTPTHALLPGSPAIDAGDDSLTGTDQRGRPRKSGAHVDIGAFEFQVPTPQSVTAPRRTTNGAFQFIFTNLSDVTPNVLASTNVSLASTQWLNLGPATLITNGLYQFTDPAITNNRQRFFQLRWP